MKFWRFIVSFLFLLCFSAKAQLDLEHWFPPVFKTAGAATQFYIYISTDKIQPFKVKIYTNNQQIDEVTVSKANPVAYEFTRISSLIVNAESRSMIPIDAGIHLAGEKSFYASFRIGGLPTNQKSEVFASKGKTALGKEFFVVNDLNSIYTNDHMASQLNYQASVIATRDNTHVKITGFKDNMVFADGNKYPEGIDVTLNKGQSFIVLVQKKDNYNPWNDDYDPNLIGTKITADHPVVLSNGNYMGNDTGESNEANINMDQSLPVEKIGKEYIIVNGMTTATSGMEKPVIVATQNNTRIYFNDETIPFRILNEGEFYIGPFNGSKFLDSGQPAFTNSNGKSIPTKYSYIRADKPFYLYQLIGGYHFIPRGPVPDFTYLTSGMNFSYPIDKNYFPDPRQNLSNTIVIPAASRIGAVYMDAKLSIKTPAGANVKVNGSLLTNPDSVTGKNGWSFYTLVPVAGDLEIASDKSLNVDLVGGKEFTGFGSSYTGFSNDPFIIKNGNCVEEGVFLYLNNKDFEGFQWQLNGVDIQGANYSTYIPTAPGLYTCVCYYADFAFVTQPINVVACPYVLTDKDLGKFCHHFYIDPIFSPPRTRNEVVSTQILTQPLQGTATVSGTTVAVNIDDNFSGNNRIVYKITDENGFYEIVKANFIIHPSPSAILKNSIFPIRFQGTSYVYNLTESIASNPDSDNIRFYPSEQAAQNQSGEITGNNIISYTTTQTSVYVRVTNSFGCFVIRKVELIQVNNPNPPTGNPDATLPNVFSPNGDGINDVWNYSSLSNISGFKLAIFDRFGRKVYEHQEQEKSFWNGKNGTGFTYPSGSYWIYYSYNDESGNNASKTMWLLLKNR